jgi:hypothetical protein
MRQEWKWVVKTFPLAGIEPLRQAETCLAGYRRVANYSQMVNGLSCVCAGTVIRTIPQMHLMKETYSSCFWTEERWRFGLRENRIYNFGTWKLM